jgi:hypothetical protein
MDKEDAECDSLLVKTAVALDGKTLNLFCLSNLRNDVESHIKNVINQ